MKYCENKYLQAQEPGIPIKKYQVFLFLPYTLLNTVSPFVKISIT